MNNVLFISLIFFFILLTPVGHSAQYRVVELPVSNLGKHTFPAAINNTGDMAVNVDLIYNPPIDTTLINFNSLDVVLGLTNLDSVRGGDLNNTDYTWLFNYLISNSGSQKFQQIATVNSFVATDGLSEPLAGFDTIDPNTNEYRNSAATQVRSINNFGFTVGVSQDGFYSLDYLDRNFVEQVYILNDFFSRGFAQIDDNIVELAPPDTTAGGLSDAYDINSQNQVVGVGTTAFVTDFYASQVNACADPLVRGDVPEASCLRSLSLQLASEQNSAAQQRGLIWQLDERGEVLDTFTLGMLITPDSADLSVYSSKAVAINDRGIAVGESPNIAQDNSSLTVSAAIYDGDDVFTINQDDEVFSSTAYDINNDNLLVGHGTKLINGAVRTKFFVHDMEADLTIYPNDFFEGSSSSALSINAEGMIVGFGEDESSSGVRRTQGFIYDYKNDVFQGISSLIECNSPYTIVQANAINDNNEIAATALVKGAARNIRGEILLDRFGAESEIEQVIAVKLVPISGGSIDNCDTSEEVVRQGASIYWLLTLLIFTGAFRLQKNRMLSKKQSVR